MFTPVAGRHRDSTTDVADMVLWSLDYLRNFRSRDARMQLRRLQRWHTLPHSTGGPGESEITHRRKTRTKIRGNAFSSPSSPSAPSHLLLFPIFSFPPITFFSFFTVAHTCQPSSKTFQPTPTPLFFYKVVEWDCGSKVGVQWEWSEKFWMKVGTCWPSYFFPATPPPSGFHNASWLVWRKAVNSMRTEYQLRSNLMHLSVQSSYLDAGIRRVVSLVCWSR